MRRLINGRVGKFLSVLLLLCFLMPLFTTNTDAADLIVNDTRLSLGSLSANVWKSVASFSVLEQERIVALSSVRYKGIDYKRHYSMWYLYVNGSDRSSVNISYRIQADGETVLQGTCKGSYDPWNRLTSWRIPEFQIDIKGAKNIKVELLASEGVSVVHYDYGANYSNYNEIRAEYTDRLTAQLLSTPLYVEEVKQLAQNAETAAIDAKTEAADAKSAANTASARVWDTTTGKSAASLAREARDKANNVEAKINNVQTEINDIKNIVTNIQNSATPHIQKISGRNGATCTRTSSFDVTIQASDAVEFRVKSDSGTWSNWASLDNYATATGLSSPGVYTIFIEAKSPSGATAMGQMMVFKL